MVKVLGFILLLAQYAAAAPLSVAVASNAKYAFDAVAVEFKKDSGIEVVGIFGSAGKLAAQINSGAPFDVFVSADTEYPDALYREGMALTRPRVYAHGVLVLWTLKDWTLSVSMLAAPSVQKIAIANPRLAPYGRAAMQALESASSAVVQKLVYGESIAQTAQFVYSGAADLGFIAKSLLYAPEMVGKGKWIAVPASSYAPIAQAAVVLKHAAQTDPEAAHKFVDYLFGSKARDIFVRYGYTLP